MVTDSDRFYGDWWCWSCKKINPATKTHCHCPAKVKKPRVSYRCDDYDHSETLRDVLID